MSALDEYGQLPVATFGGLAPEPLPVRPHPTLTVAALVGTNRPPSGPRVRLFPACSDRSAMMAPVAGL
ncbi:hypothetical protein AB0N87_25105 [Streptomyces sp. NPDC093228]|uniref:hypothetical protein n=1 Tax=Streptomyces sp. NPDC093228 TaxID=3155070 RepID=UPI0034447AFC